MNEKTTKNRVQTLRLAVLAFLKSVIMLDASIAQLVTERLSGQPVLFPDSAAKLAEQLQMATDLSTWFNMLAVAVGAAEIDLEEPRNSLQSEIVRTVSIWVNQARVGMLGLFGTVQEVQAAMDQVFLLCEPKSGEPKSLEVSINTAGEIVGSYIDANNVYYRFVYDANGTRTEFNAPGAGTGGRQGFDSGLV
jgi:hypothetical protein